MRPSVPRMLGSPVSCTSTCRGRSDRLSTVPEKPTTCSSSTKTILCHNVQAQLADVMKVPASNKASANEFLCCMPHSRGNRTCENSMRLRLVAVVLKVMPAASAGSFEPCYQHVELSASDRLNSALGSAGGTHLARLV